MTNHMHTADGSDPGPLICETCGQKFGAVEREDADVNGWRPIATAPEGVMLLFCSMQSIHACDWCYVDWMVDGKLCGVSSRPMPTHWQPLPPPPSEETER